tara:strand:- start:453 stop:668 length:216 start_codon:yes stop_codon:yes gene_type:complete
MISREAINREIDRIDGRLKVLETMLGRPGVTSQDFKNEIEKSQELVENLRSMIAREPFSGHEINVNSNINR